MIASLWIILLGLFCGATGKNVLFITIDDLRPDLGCYQNLMLGGANDPPIYSPNIDALARKSLLLQKAYVQQALCSPSRTSFLTSRRPDTTKVYDLHSYFRTTGGNFTTLPQYFKNHGHMSVGIGKIFHPGAASGHDDPLSWSLPFIQPQATEREQAASSSPANSKSWASISDNLLADDPLIDQVIANYAKQALRGFANRGKYANKPFFLAVGFHRPHLPFVSPSSFQQHYPPNVLKLPNNRYAPADMPDVAWINYRELRSYTDIKELNATGDINTTLPDLTTLELRRAYYSAVSWVDSLVGQVIDELNRLGLAHNTVISLLGDHGFKLGEHGLWCKATNFELDAHAPMMIRIPGLTDHGVVTNHITEFVDLFPTIVEAAGLPKLPICPENSSHTRTCTEGESLMPLFSDPAGPWKHAAFSQYPRHGNKVMGYSMRTNRYRYTEWPNFNMTSGTPDWTNLNGVELYDYRTDPNENVNQANDPAYASLRQQFSYRLRRGWRMASPSLKPALIG